jgi:phospholipid transport system substrate-binding protein
MSARMRASLLSLFAACVFIGAAGAANAQTIPGPGPQQMIEKVSQDMLRDIDANRAALRQDPARLRALVDKNLLPNFDADYSARLVLGKHWRTATPEQKQRFVEAFIQSMMRQYGTALLDFTGDRLTILPFKGDPAATTATVRTEVKRDNGTPVPVNYTLRGTPQGWKAWDVTIEGVSYVKNFRTDFGSEIDAKGLDAVIKRLETENTSSQNPAKPAASAKAG